MAGLLLRGSVWWAIGALVSLLQSHTVLQRPTLPEFSFYLCSQCKDLYCREVLALAESPNTGFLVFRDTNWLILFSSFTFIYLCAHVGSISRLMAYQQVSLLDTISPAPNHLSLTSDFIYLCSSVAIRNCCVLSILFPVPESLCEGHFVSLIQAAPCLIPGSLHPAFSVLHPRSCSVSSQIVFSI